ncbi:restriction endonuclease [bacterium]|nr:restriction endonuclease [bacterium]
MKYTNHLNSAADLVTSYEETRAGFLALALEKNREATPFVEETKILKELVSKVNSADDLIENAEIMPSLLTAAGISEKAERHLTEQDKKEAIKGLIDKFLLPVGESFRDELIFRYLLIRGDTLGGKMRNLGGILAERKVTRALIATLSVLRKPFCWFEKDTLQWIRGRKNNPNIELHIKGLYWKNEQEYRLLIYNLTVPFVGSRGKNVDLCLFYAKPIEYKSRGSGESCHRTPNSYLALGELKGGIDPAGADEHWKTANTALERIREAFSNKGFQPKTFFIAAAIENAMANEIYTQLSTGTINNAANLTVDAQLSSICKWLVAL